MQKTIFLILVSFSLILLSCEKKEEKAGLEIQPDENRLKVYYHTFDNLNSSTTYGGAVKTGKLFSQSLLGSINEDVFGKTSAFIVSQFRLSSDNVSFPTDAQIVSTELYLDITGAIGDTTSFESHIKIHESEYALKVDNDSLISSDESMIDEYGNLLYGDLLADENIKISPAADLQISLSNTIGERILKSTQLKDNESFIEEFNGLYLTVDTNFTEKGCIYKIDLNSTKSYIELTYNIIEDGTPVSKTFKLQFNSKCTRFNQYFNNLTALGTELDPTSTSDKVYVSGTGGVRGILNLSPVYTYRDSSDIIIYKAELIVKATTLADITFPGKLLLIKDLDEDEKNIYVDDYINGQTTNYGGAYNSETSSYSLVITRHIQNLINKNHNDTLVEIIPYSKETNPYRVILNNGENDKMTLKLTYSKLN